MQSDSFETNYEETCYLKNFLIYFRGFVKTQIVFHRVSSLIWAIEETDLWKKPEALNLVSDSLFIKASLCMQKDADVVAYKVKFTYNTNHRVHKG
jgi:hypothetical protein